MASKRTKLLYFEGVGLEFEGSAVFGDVADDFVGKTDRDFDLFGWLAGSGVLRDISSFFCLDEQTNGRVMIVGQGENEKARFINSSIAQFAASLLVIREYRQWELHKYMDREEFGHPFIYDDVTEMGAEVRKKLHWIDSDAFIVPEEQDYSFWEKFLLWTEIDMEWQP